MEYRKLEDIRYIPLLTVRPAEMQALEELPEHDKNLMMPFFHLGPWTTAHHLNSSLERLEEAYGERPCFITLAEPEINGAERPVHQQLAALRNSANGYDAWCKFVESNVNFVPTVQLTALDQLSKQVARLYLLGRGLMVSIAELGFAGAERISEIVAPLTGGGKDVCFLLDFGKIKDANWVEGRSSVYASEILRAAPNAHVAISASSFPESFGAVSEQEIYERIAFNNVAPKIGPRLIYSDRGSARAERQTGGGGTPLPRIDYPHKIQWAFFRSEETEDRNQAYFRQAQDAMASKQWDPKLRIWGTQMIERTALGDRSAIVSPKRSTAARINIHLHRQLFYNDPMGMYDTDDEWSD